MEGQTLSHYRVLERLGGGGMGVVYKAVDTSLDRPVALKFLPPALTRDDDARRRFVQEAKAASALDHANVCTIYEIGSTPDDELFIAMGYYEGKTLKERIESGPLPISEAIDIVRQVGDGLVAAHAAGIVHRDVKPANIILTTAGSAKILDFGIAKLTGVTGLTDTGITMGTVSYMSPEQVNGEGADQQSDVWALGAVFYEMLTGQPPFGGDRPGVVMHAISSAAPIPVPALRPDTPPAVARVVTRALEKSRRQRHATVGELLDALPSVSTNVEPSAAVNGSADMAATDATVVTEIDSEDRSIAVLPFADLSPAKDQDYFCEGLAEELLDALAKLDGLRVVGRTSSFQFKGQASDLRDVGQKLNVKTVLEGSVRKAGNHLRINAQLSNTDDGYQLWSARYDRTMDDIFAVQDEIARAVVKELQVRLLGSTDRPLVVRPTDNLEAYACYMQGRHYRFSRYNTTKARQCFEEAVRLDPTFAAAWAGIAEAVLLTGIFQYQPPREVSATARAAVQRALALDDTLADAHTALAKIHLWFDWQWDDAEREFRRAIELNPANADSYASYGHFLVYMERMEEALGQAARARAIDPLSTHAFVVIGYANIYLRQYQDAVVAFRQAIDLEPDSTTALWHLAITYLLCSQPEKALETLRGLSGTAAKSSMQTGLLGHALARAGHVSEAKQILRELRSRSEHEYVGPSSAQIYLGLREFELTLDCLEAGCDEQSPGLITIQRPDFDPIRDHPRFQQIQRRVGLPDPHTSARSGAPDSAERPGLYRDRR